MNLEELKKENGILKRQLSIAKMWMGKEVKSQIKNIAKGQISKASGKEKNIFFSENIEEIITKKVSVFFGELMILNTPLSVIENIISAEVSYFHLRENPTSDGLGVVSSFHKSLDTLIESSIIKGFRKFAIKKGQIHLRKNDSLEKALHLVVNKGYILSVGRLYHIIKIIKEEEELYDYGECFKLYLEKYNYISDILFEENFYNNFTSLVSSEILGKKRHIGTINFNETRKARKLFIGDFEDKNSIIYKFIEIGKVDF